MKKLLFVCYGLGIGGIEKCLVNLINALPEDRFDIDLLLMNPEYDFRPEIKRNVTFLDAYRYVMNTTDTMREIREHGGVLRNLPKFLSYCAFRVAVKFRLSGTWKLFRALKTDYDVAVAYSQQDYSPYYVIDKVNAKRKVLWYHNGAYEKNEKEYRRDKRYFPRFDYVVAVSSDCAKVLRERFSLDDKHLIQLRNICDVEAITTKAAAFVPAGYDANAVQITTVGRLTREKGADIALEACQMLAERGCRFCWHWVGDGNQREATEQAIVERSLQDRFVLEGDQRNPYPFVQACDIYVQPSYYEAYSTTVTEARVLKKPIVTTDVGGMRDQLEDGMTGLIVPIDALALADAIGTLIDHTEKRQALSDRLSDKTVDNQESMEAYWQTVFS